jgi:hypothetical protein
LTICIAALADNGNALVCIADKMLTIGDYSQWDSDITKIVTLPKAEKTDIYALIAGGIGQCEAVLGELCGIGDLDESLPRLAKHLGDVYMKHFSHFQEVAVLHKRGISKEDYVRAISSQSISPPMQKVYDEMEEFYFDCDIMLCGINRFLMPYMITVSPPGNSLDFTRQGFNSIGIGADIANSRLLWCGYKRIHPLGRVLFNLFDAKANAEMSPGVGFGWDGIVIFNDNATAYRVPEAVKALIERSWDEQSRSPFEEWNPDEDLPPPPEGWRDRILALSKKDLEILK